MFFRKLGLKGTYCIEIEPLEDERGFFARSFCATEFEKQGLVSRFVQNNLSMNKKKGTLRGMHYQDPPFAEVKLVSCLKGAIYDVIVDLRQASPTRYQWLGVELTPEPYKMLYVPEGFAHGYQTLEDHTMVFYQVSEFYNPQFERGIRYDDPSININWPIKDPIISHKDLSFAMK
jgi:dTDP-4-dehydrorhamnose 3,5-epimerase